MASHIPILIVGAGPTGLMMACELARHGAPFRILDKKPERTLTANAVGIQTRTLELFDNLGIVHQFLKIGHECRGLQFHENGKSLAKLSFEHLDSHYHFMLSLPQSETERLLIAHLNDLKREVERPFELITIEEQGQLLCCTFQDPEGKVEIISCDWLIACDGANSKVRELCQIAFKGEDLSEQFMVANTQMSTFLSTHEVQGFFNQGTLLFAIPFGSHSYRIGVNLHQSPRKFLIEKEVKEMVQERSHGDYDVNSVSWISPFWIHSKAVENMRHGSVFLAGDAAHIHSPAGAQGMNAGLQDAYNLAWKLALVVKGQAKVSLLDSYHQERYPIVQDIVKRAERFTKLALSQNYFLITLRKLFFKLLNQPKIAKKVSMQLTQLSFCYRQSAIISYREKISRKGPQPGERAPDVRINQNTRLHHYLRTSQHKVLLFTGLAADESRLNTVKALEQALNRRYAKTVKVLVITAKPLDDRENIILDEAGLIHQRYGVKAPAVYLIRPDNYLAYCSSNLDPKPLLQFLETYLT